MVTSLLPVVVPIAISSTTGAADVPIARELTLDKLVLSVGTLTSGTLQAQIKRNGAIVGGTVTISASGIKVWEDLDISFSYGDVLRIDWSGTPVGLADCYVTLWLRMQIN